MADTQSTEGQLKRELSKTDILALSFGAMIGWSWVAIAGDWIGRGGSLGAGIAFVFGGLATLLIALTYAELASAMPQAGGEHVYTERALGHGWSFIVTWSIIFAYVGVAAFESLAIATVAEHFWPSIKTGFLWHIGGHDVFAGSVAVGMATTALITLLNIRGIRMAAIFQVLATILIIIGGAVLVTGTSLTGDVANAEPLFVGGIAGVAGVLVMVPAMLIGFDVIPQSAEEINLPFRDIGRVLIFSVACAVLWYMLIVYGVSFSLDDAGRQAPGITTALAAERAWNSKTAGDLLVLAGLGGILTSWNAFVIGGSRALYALARAGHLPRRMGHLHPKYNTPWVAVGLIGLICFLSPLLGRQALIWIIDATGIAIVFAYGMVSWSFLKLRKIEPDMDRPYRVKHGRIVGWAAVAMSVFMMTLYLPGSPAALIWPWEWGMLAGWATLGLVLYLMARFKTPAR